MTKKTTRKMYQVTGRKNIITNRLTATVQEAFNATGKGKVADNAVIAAIASST
jgi:hypothetical protein